MGRRETMQTLALSPLLGVLIGWALGRSLINNYFQANVGKNYLNNFRTIHNYRSGP